MELIFGDGLLVAVCYRCSVLWVWLCYLHDSGIGLFRLVCRWWMWGVVLRNLGSVGLPDDVMPVSTL